MKQQVSLREANQNFSRYVAAVERGVEIVITRRGKPVARLVGLQKQKKLNAQQTRALAHFLAAGRDLGISPFNRDEIYDRV